MNFRKHITSVAFAIAALSAGSANAGIVTKWTVGVSAIFKPGTVVESSGTLGSVVLSGDNQHLDWGPGAGGSGLDIGDSPVDTQVTTGLNGELPPVANISVTHRNNAIDSAYRTLDKVTLESTLTLTPLVPVLPGLPSATLSFLIDFFETPNAGTDGICADGGTPNVGPINGNGCGDIFVIDQGSLNFSFFYDTDGVGGDDPQEYFISFVELTGGLNSLPNAACLSTTGIAAPCLGFVTPEAANTTFQFGALITTERVSINVPAPGVLGLMGLGLLGLAGIRRRKA